MALLEDPFADLVPPTAAPTLYGRPKAPAVEGPGVVEGRELENLLKRQRLAKGDPMGDGAAKLKESENTAGFLTTNVLTNVNILSGAVKADPNAAAPTWGQIAAGLAGTDVKNQFLPAQRQVVENAQRLIVDNLLTLGTGAAYTPVQIDAYRRGFFPQVGDTPEAIEAKKKSLRGAMLAARIKAGNAAPQIDEAMSALGLSSDPLVTDAVPNVPDEGGPKGTHLTAEQEKEYAAFLRGKPDAAAITAWLTARNLGTDNAEEVAAALREGRPVGPPNYSKIDAEAEAVARAEIERQDKDGPMEIGGDRSRLLKQGAMLGLGDEASGTGAALGNIITSPITGNFDPVGRYKVGRDAERVRLSDIRDQLGYQGTAIEVAGGFLSANPEAALAPLAGRMGLVRQGAKAGAYGGALGGFGYGEGTEGSVQGAVLGGAAGAVLGSGVSALSSRFASQADPAIAAAALAEKVRAPRLLLEGTRKQVNRAGRLDADSSSAPIVQQGLANVNEDIGAGVERLGRGGTAGDRASIGEAAREAAKTVKAADREASTTAYKAAEAIDGDPPVDMAAMRGKLDAEIARLQRTPGTNEDAIKVLQRYRRDIDQPLPLSAVRDMRTTMKDSINSADMTRSSGQRRADRRALSALEGAKSDIQGALSSEAWKAWSEADALYAGSQQFIKEALVPFFGKDLDQLPAEQIFDRIKNAANRNGRALASFHRRVGPELSRDMAATVAESLGRAGPDEAFSTARFISQARKYSKSARETIFGPSGSASFDNLLRLSRKLERVKGEINTSKTARPLSQVIREKAHHLITAMLGVGGYGMGGPAGGAGGVAAGVALQGVGAAVGGVRRALSAKALMNPRVTAWLEKAADVSTPAQAQETVRRLGVVIGREPALAGELQPIHDMLTQRLTQPVAASEPETENQQ